MSSEKGIVSGGGTGVENAVLDKIARIGIVPVVRIDRVSDALPLARALYAGGIPCAEITFRTEHAAAAISAIHAEMPEMLLGAGTVLTPEQVDRAAAAGASFAVSPGLNPRVVSRCLEKGIPVAPGCSSPSDIECALEMGLDTVKFFPAESVGGLAAIKAMSAPYGNVKFMPTGGINAKNLAEYLAFPKIIACGGSWMADPALVAAGDFEEITRRSAEAMRIVTGFKLAHIGINAGNEKEAADIAGLFAAAFGFTAKAGASSIFAGPVEVMKAPYLGEKGHIAIGTGSIPRALAYLEARGFSPDPDTAKHDAGGNLLAIYLKGNFGGFAVHLVRG